MHGQRSDRADPRIEQRDCARLLARRFSARAWDLIEQRERSPIERAEMTDAAHAARALWRLATGTLGSLEMLRAHQAVACAAAKAGDAAGARAAARLATACSWVDSPDLTPLDRVMTMTAEYLAALAQNGFTDPEPLMRAVLTLAPHERARLSRLLPWPKERFALEPTVSGAAPADRRRDEGTSSRGVVGALREPAAVGIGTADTPAEATGRLLAATPAEIDVITTRPGTTAGDLVEAR